VREPVFKNFEYHHCLGVITVGNVLTKGTKNLSKCRCACLFYQHTKFREYKFPGKMSVVDLTCDETLLWNLS